MACELYGYIEMSVAHTRVGPTAKLDDDHSHQLTFRQKFGNVTCAMCTHAISDSDATHMWYCRNGSCDAKCHIHCICMKLEAQVTNTNIKSVACPKCDTRLEPADRENVFVLAIGDLRSENAQLKKELFEAKLVIADLSRRLEESELWRDEHERSYQRSQLELEQTKRSLEEAHRIINELRQYIDGVHFRSMEEVDKRVKRIEQEFEKKLEVATSATKALEERLAESDERMRVTTKATDALIKDLLDRVRPS